jgi:DnaK suppressor protein
MAIKKKSTKRKVTTKKNPPGKKGTKTVKKKTSSKAKVKTKAKIKVKAKAKVKTKAKTKIKTKAKTKIKTKAKTKTKTRVKKPKQLSKPRPIKLKKVVLGREAIKIREQLTLNQQELLNIIHTNQSTERKTSESNFSNEIDMASDLEGREMMFQLTSRDRSELKRIQDAIYKIDHGVYGICESCSKQISTKRLKILPLSTLCIQCKEAIEQA